MVEQNVFKIISSMLNFRMNVIDDIHLVEKFMKIQMVYQFMKLMELLPPRILPRG